MNEPALRRERRGITASDSLRASGMRAELSAFFDEEPVRRAPGARDGLLRVHFICTGNVCRSPLAAALMSHALNAAGITAGVDSSGLSAAVDAHADPATRHFAAGLGVDLRSHRARQFIPEFAIDSDLVLTATLQQRDQVIGLAPAATQRIFALASFAALVADPRRMDHARTGIPALVADASIRRQLRQPRPSDDIPDPIGRLPAVHKAVGEQIAAAVNTIAAAFLRA